MARARALTENGPLTAHSGDSLLRPLVPPEDLPAWLYADLEFRLVDGGRGTRALLPPLCPVPAGVCRIGSETEADAEAFRDEMPAHTVRLPAFAISRYAVSVAEYACYLHATGARPPTDWVIQRAQLDAPITNVTFLDAAAYATWLAQLTGQPWRLPSEAEWEKAARWVGGSSTPGSKSGAADAWGEHARRYPWGDTFLARRAAVDRGPIFPPTPVHAFPLGTSAVGALGMAGNVWEWTASRFSTYPLGPDGWPDDREPARLNRVLRGGAVNGEIRYTRAACRTQRSPLGLGAFVGFRLVREGAEA